MNLALFRTSGRTIELESPTSLPLDMGGGRFSFATPLGGKVVHLAETPALRCGMDRESTELDAAQTDAGGALSVLEGSTGRVMPIEMENPKLDQPETHDSRNRAQVEVLSLALEERRRNLEV